MNEAYAEWLVKRKTQFISYVLVGLMGVVTVICVLLALTGIGGIISMILMFLAGGATYLLHRNTNIEFEYLYIGGQLSIDKIMGRAKRKKVWEGSMDDIQIIAPSDSYVLKDYARQGARKVDVSSGIPGVKTYTIMVQAGANSSEIVFEPNDKMLHCIRQTAPRKVVL